ncbi:MAG TPA: hypothetical protein VHV49_19525 [Pseudonocardiaceae bacterium]|nr:hypothetical protein [Pseudonocardiaceae bacterium]
MSELNCERMHDLAPELALDILTGYERATAQAHLIECPACRAYVGSLAQVSDRLLTLVPGAEPPVGFEDRALSRMGLTKPAPKKSRRTWLAISAAAAVAALVFGIGGWVMGGGMTAAHPQIAAESQGNGIRVATFRTAGHQAVGEVFTYQSDPSWVYMAVHAPSNVDWVACQLVKRDGSIVQIGAFTLSSGKGTWSSDLQVDPNTVATARLVSSKGTILAAASFDAGDQPEFGSH